MRMSVEEVIARVAELPREEWGKVQSGIADLMAAELTSGDVAEVREALAAAEGEFRDGAGGSAEEVRKVFGLR